MTDFGTGAEVREAVARGLWRRPTSGLAPGYTQANVVILPLRHAFDFLLYCQRNERPCPVIDVCEPGTTAPAIAAGGADIRIHVPRYRVYREGRLVEERDDILGLFDAGMVTFLLGCSFTFEGEMIKRGFPVRHVELGRNVPMYVTDIETRPAGPFSGPLVVSMRPVPREQVEDVVRLTTPYRKAHGAPIHAGDPRAIGIRDIGQVDFGDPPDIRPGEVPVFWACGVTPQVALRRAKPDIAITHAPGHMFVTDILEADLLGW